MLGKHAETQNALRRAEAILADLEASSAACLAHEGDSMTAATYATQALTELTEDQRHGIIMLRAREIHKAIPARQRALPAVREFDDLLIQPSNYNAVDGS
jgi:hypothetical protein